MQIPTDKLHEAASEFTEVSKESQLLVERLEKVTGGLQTDWESASQQLFFKNYKQWHQHMQGYVTLLDMIAKEMHAMADRYEEADKD